MGDQPDQPPLSSHDIECMVEMFPNLSDLPSTLPTLYDELGRCKEKLTEHLLNIQASLELSPRKEKKEDSGAPKPSLELSQLFALFPNLSGLEGSIEVLLEECGGDQSLLYDKLSKLSESGGVSDPASSKRPRVASPLQTNSKKTPCTTKNQSDIRDMFAAQSPSTEVAEKYRVPDTETRIADADKLFAVPEAMEKVLAMKWDSCVLLCKAPKLIFYTNTEEKRPYSCGYRNTQMILSAAFDMYETALSRAGVQRVPSIAEMQQTIEKGWARGLDDEGARHFNGKISGKKVWIGTPEAHVFLKMCGLPVRHYDFSKNWANGENYVDNMLDLAYDYFQKHKNRDRVMPIYFQFAGHSRTCIGVAEVEGKKCLVCLDPAFPVPFLHNLSNRVMKKFLFDKAKLRKHDEFQLLFVYGQEQPPEYYHTKTYRPSGCNSNTFS